MMSYKKWKERDRSLSIVLVVDYEWFFSPFFFAFLYFPDFQKPFCQVEGLSTGKPGMKAAKTGPWPWGCAQNDAEGGLAGPKVPSQWQALLQMPSPFEGTLRNTGETEGKRRGKTRTAEVAAALGSQDEERKHQTVQTWRKTGGKQKENRAEWPFGEREGRWTSQLRRWAVGSKTVKKKHKIKREISSHHANQMIPG